MLTIRSLSFSPLDVSLREPFGIATGTQVVAANVLVELTLSDGTQGLGEAAPFPAVSGETQAMVIDALPLARAALLGKPALRYRWLSAELGEALSAVPSALAGVEIALLDALARHMGRSLWDWFGGSETTLVSDITIPTAETDDPIGHAIDSSHRACGEGFRTLKIKVGKSDIDTDVKRVVSVAAAASDCAIILDANGAYTVTDALRFIAALEGAARQVILFEQPVARDDLDGLLEVEAKSGIAVAADESLRGAADLRRLARLGGPSVVNLKTAKCGLVLAADLAAAARSLGFRLMIGGMVETELSMTASACLAAGLGGFEFVDLDTPFFMGRRHLQGGAYSAGPQLELANLGLGHGVTLAPRSGSD